MLCLAGGLSLVAMVHETEVGHTALFGNVFT